MGPRDEAGGNIAEADAEEVEQVAVAGGPGEEVGEAAAQAAAVVAGYGGAA